MFCGMNTQNQIKRALSESASIEYVRGLLASNKNQSRSQLADVVCEHFGFHDPRGKKQISGCLKALHRLEDAGHFVLPESQLSDRKLRGYRSLFWNISEPATIMEAAPK